MSRRVTPMVDNEFSREDQFLEAYNRLIDKKDPYAALGIEKGIDENSLKKAVKNLKFLVHPDKNPLHKEQATEAFQKIAAHLDNIANPSKQTKSSVAAGGTDDASEGSSLKKVAKDLATEAAKDFDKIIQKNLAELNKLGLTRKEPKKKDLDNGLNELKRELGIPSTKVTQPKTTAKQKGCCVIS